MKRLLCLIVLSFVSFQAPHTAAEIRAFGAECLPMKSGNALTDEVRKKAREAYNMKHEGKRRVIGDKVYPTYKDTPTVVHCLFYENILPAPPERPGKRMLTLAPAGVFFCLLL